MRYVPIMNGVVTTIKADPLMSELLGTAIYEEGEHDFDAPSLTWTLISEVPEGEVFSNVQVQFDPFLRSRRDRDAVQTALRQMFDKMIEWHLPSTGGFSGGFDEGFEGEASLLVRSWFLAARHYRTSQGIWGGSMDFQFTAVRPRYTGA